MTAGLVRLFLDMIGEIRYPPEVSSSEYIQQPFLNLVAACQPTADLAPPFWTLRETAASDHYFDLPQVGFARFILNTTQGADVLHLLPQLHSSVDTRP
jgi:hypothetical protein